MERHIYRAIDANINRVAEGLRVIEDLARFYYNDEPTQATLKKLRHSLSSMFEQERFILYRDSLNDIGFSSVGAKEMKREGIKDVLRSNLKRVEEGLRVLEELFKLESTDISMGMKKLRYDVYDVEKSMLGRINRRILRKGLYLIISESSQSCEDIARMAVDIGIPAVQLRLKYTSDSDFLSIAMNIRAITAGTDTLFIVNDRLDIAMLSGADGVHLGQRDLPPDKARKILSDQAFIGLSTHSLDQAKKASYLDVDYIGFGPIWHTDTKNDVLEPTGVARLKQCVEQSQIPVVAIGGINKKRLESIEEISCNNIAVISAVRDADDPYRAILELNNMFIRKVCP